MEQGKILREAYSILRAEGIERQHAALMTEKERTAPPRLSTDLDTIVHAAFEGRVGQLYLNQRAVKMDVFDQGTYQSWGEEDLLNVAAVETIAHHGKACELPSEKMPDGLAAIAIMRF